jgi:hypothetical protein
VRVFLRDATTQGKRDAQCEIGKTAADWHSSLDHGVDLKYILQALT